MANVYHYTTSLHLPWIFDAKELRPGTNRIGGFPFDFLWATTNEKGSRSATGYRHWRKYQGDIRLVRFALPVEAFEDWRAAVERAPEWTPEHIRRLEESAAKMGDDDIHRWRVRREPFSLEGGGWAVHTRSYTGRWIPLTRSKTFDLSDRFRDQTNDPVLGVLIGDDVHIATRHEAVAGAMRYADLGRVPYAELFAA